MDAHPSKGSGSSLPRIDKANCIADGSGAVGVIYLGSIASAQDLSQLRAARITHVVDLTVHGFDAAKTRHNGIKYLHVNVKDQPGAELSPHFRKASEFIHAAHAGGGRVLVHCLHGKSRSSAVVIAYLLINHAMSLADAYALCKRRRHQVAPNVGFMQQLSDLEQQLHGGSGAQVRTLNPVAYAADQLWGQVHLGYIQGSKPLAKRHCLEAIAQNPPMAAGNNGLIAATEWLENLDPDTIPPEPEPEPEPSRPPKWGEKGWDPTSPAPDSGGQAKTLDKLWSQ